MTGTNPADTVIVIDTFVFSVSPGNEQPSFSEKVILFTVILYAVVTNQRVIAKQQNPVIFSKNDFVVVDKSLKRSKRDFFRSLIFYILPFNTVPYYLSCVKLSTVFLSSL